MTVKQACELLAQLPDDAILMVPSLGHGGSVPLQGFTDVDRDNVDQNPHWIDVEYCEDDEKERFGL